MSDAEHMEPDIGDCSVFDVDTTGPAANRSRCCNLTIRVIFSTPGLVALVIVYSVLGALIFPLLEARHGNGQGGGGPSGLTMSISKSREDCLRELWTITERLNVLYERNWTMLVHEQLRRFEGSIVAATKGRFGNNGQLIDPSTAAVLSANDGPGWSFKESLLYSVTVITTIGHGNMTPRTAEGKLVTMVYALFGVPLMLMCLSSLGGLLAEALQCAYCRVCQRRTRRNSHQLQETGDKFALPNGCATKRKGSRRGGDTSQSCDEMDCDGRSCKYDYMPVRSGDSGGSQNNSAEPYQQQQQQMTTTVTGKPQVEEGNIYTGSPRHPTTGSYPPHSTFNSYTMIPNAINAGHHQQGVFHPLQGGPQLTYHPPNLLVDTGGTPFGTPTKKFFLAEMPIEYTQISGNNHQQQHQQLQDAVTNVSLHPQSNMQNQMANGLMSNTGNCVILLNPNTPHHVVPMHNSTLLGKSKFMSKPLPQEINLLIAESSEMDCQQQQQQQKTQQLLNAMNYTPGTMDDEEDEDSRSCPPHGTPSKMPLIKRTGNNSSLKVSFSDTCKKFDECDMLADHQSHGRSLNRNGDFGPNDRGVDEGGGDDDEFGEGGEPLTQVPMLLIFVILLCYISLGAIIFVVWEDWSLIDGAYFCFVTLSTIGFGDLVPLRTFRGPELQLVACFLYLLLGLVLVAMTFTVVENQLMWKCRRVAVRLKLAPRTP